MIAENSTPGLEELLRKRADKCENRASYADDPWFEVSGWLWEAADEIARLTALLGAAPQGEPVAWEVECKDHKGRWLHLCIETSEAAARDIAGPDGRILPLYAGAASAERGLLDAVREFLDAEDAVDREAERAGGTPGWSSAPCVRRINAVKKLRALVAAPCEAA